MPDPIPATLIAGFGATGKAQVVDALLRHKPANEHWAVLAQQGMFGAASRVHEGIPGVWIESVAPGCPCCTGLLPFSTGLTALLRRVLGRGVARLLIEGGAEGHIASVTSLLAGGRFREYLSLSRCVAVVDPLWLDRPAQTAQDALSELAQSADVLVATPWEQAGAAKRTAFAAFAAGLAPARPWTAMQHGELDAALVLGALPASGSGAH